MIVNDSLTFPHDTDWSISVIVLPGAKFRLSFTLMLSSTVVAFEIALMMSETKLRGARARRGYARFWASMEEVTAEVTLFSAP